MREGYIRWLRPREVIRERGGRVGEGDKGAGGRQAENSKSDISDSHTRGYQPRDVRLANHQKPKHSQRNEESEACDWT
jgi:hypothetical protein